MAEVCSRCGRSLWNVKSVINGMGPICARKASWDVVLEDRCDLPFDPETMDITCQRTELGLRFNIPQSHRHHSPSGFEWGYPGSGPADFALNIMALFCRERGLASTMTLWDGSMIPVEAWRLHQLFKCSKIFGAVPREGGIMKGSEIRAWVDSMLGGGYERQKAIQN